MEASFRGCLFLFATFAARKTSLFLDEAVILPFTAKIRLCFMASTRNFSVLTQNYSSWAINSVGHNGYLFSGSSTYSESLSRLYLPAAGCRSNEDGTTGERGDYDYYWSSRPHSFYAYYIFFNSSKVGSYTYSRAYGYSVRCVQE